MMVTWEIYTHNDSLTVDSMQGDTAAWGKKGSTDSFCKDTVEMRSINRSRLLLY